MIEDDFDHFTDAQDSIWPTVTLELTLGVKRSHWMWFVFPVLEGVGNSNTALFFALRDLNEAKDYIAHPILGPRLRDCAGLLLTHAGKPASEILGDTDAWKLQNCATLFAATAPEATVFDELLITFFQAKPAQRTLDLLIERGTPA